MKSYIGAIYIVTALFFSTSSLANRINIISSKEGLSNNSVYNIYQNDLGELFVGTLDGLNIWNGRDIEKKKAQEFNQFFKGNKIRYIFPYDKDHILVLSRYGLAKLNTDTKESQFYEYFMGHNMLCVTQDGNIFSINENGELEYFELTTGNHHVLKQADAHGFRGDLVVTHGLEHVAEVAVEQAHDAERHHDEPDEAGVHVCVAGDALDAQRAVGDGGGVHDEHADDLGEAERGDTKVVAAQAQDGDADEKREQRGHHAAEDHREPERRIQVGQRGQDLLDEPHHFLLIRREDAERGHVCADGHEAGVAQREHTGEAVDDVQRYGEDAVHGHEVQDLDLIAVEAAPCTGQAEAEIAVHVAAGPPQEDEEKGDEAAGEQAIAELIVLDIGHQIFSFSFSPNRPVGFTSRTTTSRMKAKASR